MSVPQPTLAGFTTFVRNVMGITTTVLPDGSPVIAFALAVPCYVWIRWAR